MRLHHKPPIANKLDIVGYEVAFLAKAASAAAGRHQGSRRPCDAVVVTWTFPGIGPFFSFSSL